MPQIQIYSDYVCPYCYLAEQILLEVAEENPSLNIEIDWKPFELRPYPTPTLKPEDEYLPRVWRQSVYPMASQLGVEIKLPSISPQPYTHLAFEGFQYAKEKGKGHAYTTRMFEAFFKENKDIGAAEVLTQLAGEVGLDPKGFRQVLANRTYREAHLEALKEANQLGIQAVPTFFIGGQFYPGILPKMQLLYLIKETT